MNSPHRGNILFLSPADSSDSRGVASLPCDVQSRRAATGWRSNQMSSAYSTRRDSPGRHRTPNRRKSSHKEQEVTETSESADVTESAAGQSAAQLLTFTIDAKTGQIVKFESLDESGVLHELTAEEKATLAREAMGDQLEEIVEQAFEAGIACVLGGGDRAQMQ